MAGSEEHCDLSQFDDIAVIQALMQLPQSPSKSPPPQSPPKPRLNNYHYPRQSQPGVPGAAAESPFSTLAARIHRAQPNTPISPFLCFGDALSPLASQLGGATPNNNFASHRRGGGVGKKDGMPNGLMLPRMPELLGSPTPPRRRGAGGFFDGEPTPANVAAFVMTPETAKKRKAEEMVALATPERRPSEDECSSSSKAPKSATTDTFGFEKPRQWISVKIIPTSLDFARAIEKANSAMGHDDEEEEEEAAKVITACSSFSRDDDDDEDEIEAAASMASSSSSSRSSGNANNVVVSGSSSNSSSPNNADLMMMMSNTTSTSPFEGMSNEDASESLRSLRTPNGDDSRVLYHREDIAAVVAAHHQHQQQQYNQQQYNQPPTPATVVASSHRNTSSTSKFSASSSSSSRRALQMDDGGDEDEGGEPRGADVKPCNCKNSRCLKLYCDCFAAGRFCVDCNCAGCHNDDAHEEQRSEAVRATLEKNPKAFRAKISKAKSHLSGCHCKKSRCLKKYCECFEADVTCGSKCKCANCENYQDSPARKARREKIVVKQQQQPRPPPKLTRTSTSAAPALLSLLRSAASADDLDARPKRQTRAAIAASSPV